MNESKRAIAREIAQRYIDMGDMLGWFEELYSRSKGDPSLIPWADLIPNPNLVAWLDVHHICGEGKRALKIGCGLGDDAEELARRGFRTTAFDISSTAIAWCKQRFPDSSVRYHIYNLFQAPKNWMNYFDFVFESYTLQVLPLKLHRSAIERISDFVKPGGILLTISRGRKTTDPGGKMPWPLTIEELDIFKSHGLEEVAFEDFMDDEDPPVRRFRVTYKKITK